MTRLASTFQRLRQEGCGGLVTFTTAGDPDLHRSAEILLALDRAGADVLEVGVPFSDPVADGPTIQRASERALRAGGSLSTALTLIGDIRPTIGAGVVVFSYANPLLAMGVETFAVRAAASGVDGVLVVDVPVEEAGPIREALGRVGIDTIFLLSPTSTDARIARAAALGGGFLYGVSLLGVTGARQAVAPGAAGLVRRIRAQTSLPIALGFGISRPEHVAEVTTYADAAVVGSALVSLVAEHADDPCLTGRLETYVRALKGACARANAPGRS
jgi:tryptophan synthase alpha chain